MVIYNRENKRHLMVYGAVFVSENFIVYYTNDGHAYSSMNLEIMSDFVYGFKDNYQSHISYSESKLIDGWYLSKELSDDFINDDERQKFLNHHEQVKAVLPQVYQEIEIDYIKWRIKNNHFEDWENNFDDKIFKISDTEYYIDDVKYDVFYDINDLDNISVLRK